MLSNTLGTAIGPFMGMAISQAVGMHGLFAVCLIIALICLVSLLWFRPPREERKPFTGGAAHLRDFIEPTAVPIGIVACLVFFGYASILTFLSSYAEQEGIQTAASFFFVAYAITMFVSRLFTGKIFDRRGANVVMIPAFVLAIAGMAAVGLAFNGAILLLGAALLGAGIGTLQSCGLTIALQKASVRRISLAWAWVRCCWAHSCRWSDTAACTSRGQDSWAWRWCSTLWLSRKARSRRGVLSAASGVNCRAR